jgi:HPr kinase/phosphorylase
MAIIALTEFVKALDLKIIYAPPDVHTLTLISDDINRPGLQLTGYFSYFSKTRVQIMGKSELSYLAEMHVADQESVLDRYFSYEIPCLIISRGQKPPEVLLDSARQYQRVVLGTDLVTTKAINKITHYLENLLAPQITRHGVLVDVYGVGILMMGESSIGKSETALELVKRGHRLVADDVIDITKVGENKLVGKAPDIVKFFMEIRGIGIINVQEMFGVGAVIGHKTIDIIICLEQWVQGKVYDRLDFGDETMEMLEVEVPTITLPVMPGRNLAIIVEVAAMNYRLKRRGYNAAAEITRRLTAEIQKREEEYGG